VFWEFLEADSHTLLRGLVERPESTLYDHDLHHRNGDDAEGASSGFRGSALSLSDIFVYIF